MKGTTGGAVAAIVMVGIWGAEPACAGGGPHVVDDSEVEAPGSCHVETWMTRLDGSAGDIVVNPACTPSTLPNLEIGAGSSYSWDHRSGAIALGPAVKWNLSPLSTGFGVAVEASTTWGSAKGRFEAASFVVPASLSLGSDVTASVNGGIEWSRAAANVGGFFGTQIMWQETRSLVFMAEAFERTQEGPGAQSGIRWSPDQNTDVDVLLSHAFNGSIHEAATVGITRRFR